MTVVGRFRRKKCLGRRDEVFGLKFINILTAWIFFTLKKFSMCFTISYTHTIKNDTPTLNLSGGGLTALNSQKLHSPVSQWQISHPISDCGAFESFQLCHTPITRTQKRHTVWRTPITRTQNITPVTHQVTRKHTNTHAVELGQKTYLTPTHISIRHLRHN